MIEATTLPAGDSLLFIVQDAFDVNGIGCVLFHGVPCPDRASPRIPVGAAITLRRPDGSVVRTRITGFHAVRAHRPVHATPISLPVDFRKEDAPPGTEVWLELSAGPPAPDATVRSI